MPRTKPPASIKKQVSASASIVSMPGAPASSEFTPTEEIGVAGVKISSGFVHDEYIPQLQGERGRRTYRQMRDNDSIIGAVFFAIEMLLRAVDWKVEIDTPDAPGSAEAVQFLEEIKDDMEHTWDDFVCNVLTMLTFGWQWTEEVYKLRLGPDQPDPTRRSKYSDGKWGIRKLAPRAQETLWRWDSDDKGEVHGLWQQPPVAGNIEYIPMEKSMLFRPHQHKGSPEGRSMLRNAYRSWYFLKNIQEVEAIGIERELNGLPVVYVPNAIINGTDDTNKNALSNYESLVRDIKYNDQGGVVLPSNTYVDADGTPTTIRQVELELLSSSGTRNIDTDKTILRYQRDMAVTVLADFVMLGNSNTASFGALADNKTQYFTRALEGWSQGIADTVNRNMVPRLWRLNGMDSKVMAKYVPGRVTPVDIQALGAFISDLASAGAPLFPDDDLENYLREAGGMPRRPEGGGDGDLSGVMPKPVTQEDGDQNVTG